MLLCFFVQACITASRTTFSAFTVNKVGTLKVKVLCTRTFFQDNSVIGVSVKFLAW
jgi:hypothetical protein